MKYSYPYQLIFPVMLLFLSCNTPEPEKIEINVIPKPAEMITGSGSYKIDHRTTINYPEEFTTSVAYFIGYLKVGSGIALTNSDSDDADIQFVVDETIDMEGYQLLIDADGIKVKSATDRGAFYAIQTLRQLLPPELELELGASSENIHLPFVEISDSPKFSYRGMHLDVGRHFFPKEYIKRYISYMAMLKMNYFHWHLTEDQGWRIEIKEYPRLTTHAAYRNETLIGHYNDSPHQFDGKRYGGFYSQEDIKEIVAYAEKHHITIIPEIEMPGHSQAAVSAYPELGCSGEQVEVGTKWGVFEHIYCPNQKTFDFLKHVLTEVAELFPGEYIHIGGDEAPKTQWKKCTHCQRMISEYNLGDESGLQSYFIKEIETFLNSKGKKIIGWDEILEGGLAPNATVMSWRGTQGGIEAAKAGHNVIMTPTSHAYFDYYQDDHPDEPLAIGGFLPLKKVYSFNPIPEELNEVEASFVLGAQGNVWTEYMKTSEQVDYMIFPRILAMSEVVWSGPSNNLEKDYPEFVNRVETYQKRLDIVGINYAQHLYNVEGEVVKRDGLPYLELTNILNEEIYYSINDAPLEEYESPIAVEDDILVRSYVGSADLKLGRPRVDSIIFHKGINAAIRLNVLPNPTYGTGGKEALINGVMGSSTRYGDKEWLGFWGDDVEIELDFIEPIELKSVKLRFFNANGQWIYAPRVALFECQLLSGITVKDEKAILVNPDDLQVEILFDFTSFPKIETSGITLKIPSYGMIPDGKQGAGHPAWTFIDEIIIE